MTRNHDLRFLPEKLDNEVPVPTGPRKKRTWLAHSKAVRVAAH